MIARKFKAIAVEQITKKTFISGCLRRISGHFRKPPPEENDNDLAVLREVDPLRRLSGPPRTPATWKLVFMSVLIVTYLLILRTWHADKCAKTSTGLLMEGFSSTGVIPAILL